MMQFIKAWRENGSRIILLEPFLFPEPAEYRSWEPVLERFQAELCKIASEENLTYIPLHEVFRSKLKEIKLSDLTLDGVHPTRKGHRIIAELWLDIYKTVKNQI